jgi:hypothetical protein
MDLDLDDNSPIPWKNWNFKLKLPWMHNPKEDAESQHYLLVDEDKTTSRLDLASKTREIPYKTFFFSLLALNLIASLAGGIAFKFLATEEIFGPPGYVPERFTPKHSQCSWR